MKRVLSMVMVVMMIVLVFGGVPVASKTKPVVKQKQIKLNKTNAVVENGKSIHLKLKNAEQKVTWSSSNKYTASVNKKGKVTGKRLGNVTITAKCKGKKYRCKVRVCSDIDADKITITYANDIFTEDLYKRIDHIDGGSCGVQATVRDKKAIKAIFSKLAALKLKEIQDPEVLCGHMECNLVLGDGEVVYVVLNRYVFVNGTSYIAEDASVTDGLGKLIDDNKDWGNN